MPEDVCIKQKSILLQKTWLTRGRLSHDEVQLSALHAVCFLSCFLLPSLPRVCAYVPSIRDDTLVAPRFLPSLVKISTLELVCSNWKHDGDSVDYGLATTCHSSRPASYYCPGMLKPILALVFAILVQRPSALPSVASSVKYATIGFIPSASTCPCRNTLD